MNNFISFLTYLSVFTNLLNTLKNILVFVLVLSIIVGIHEFGHFIFARRAKILTREFAIGMGPKLWSKKKGETLYSIRAVPIGGFCSIAGEEYEKDPFETVKKVFLKIEDDVVTDFYFVKLDGLIEATIINHDITDLNNTGNLFVEVMLENDEELTKTYKVKSDAILHIGASPVQIAPYNRTINSKTKRQRAMVMFGGPLMNFLLALVVFFIVALFTGHADLRTTEVDVSEKVGFPIEEYLEEGDKLIKLKSGGIEKELVEWNDIRLFLSEYNSKKLSDDLIVTIEKKDGRIEDVSITLYFEITSAIFGSDFDYNKTGIVKVGAYEEVLEEVGDNTQLKLNDIIIGIHTFDTPYISNPTWGDIKNVFENFKGGSSKVDENKVYLKVLRDGEELDIYVIPYSEKILNSQKTLGGEALSKTKVTIGIAPLYKFSLWKSVVYSFERTLDSFTAVFNTLGLLFSGAVTVKSLSGPVGIYSITSAVSSHGILSVLSLIGLLSVNIGFLNLLPIPALDGGRLVFLGYEAITKKKPNQKVETALILVTMILLLALMLFVTFGDVLRLFK